MKYGKYGKYGKEPGCMFHTGPGGWNPWILAGTESATPEEQNEKKCKYYMPGGLKQSAVQRLKGLN